MSLFCPLFLHDHFIVFAIFNPFNNIEKSSFFSNIIILNYVIIFQFIISYFIYFDIYYFYVFFPNLSSIEFLTLFLIVCLFLLILLFPYYFCWNYYCLIMNIFIFFSLFYLTAFEFN